MLCLIMRRHIAIMVVSASASLDWNSNRIIGCLLVHGVFI